MDTVATRCTEVESGARNVDNILTNTLLPDISRQLLGRMAEGEKVTECPRRHRSRWGVCIQLTVTPSGGATSWGRALYTAKTSLFTFTTPLGQDKLLLKGFQGSEGISRLFRFELDLLSEDPGIAYTQIIGKSVTITLTQADGTPRYFNGVISRFGQGGRR